MDPKTARGYYQILVDTQLGTMIEPFKKRQERQVITKASKFYAFDVGVAGAITRRPIPEERGGHFGRAFEPFMLMEILAHRSYRELRDDVNFWRTKSGLEVDSILGRCEVAVEIKAAAQAGRADTRAFRAFMQEHRPREAILVCNERAARMSEGITILPWRESLDMLWGGGVIS